VVDVASKAWLELDRYVEEFEAARSQDGATDLRRFAPDVGDALYLPVVRELVRVDLEMGWSEGRPRSLADYRRLVPDLFGDADSLRAIAYEEYRLRRQAGQNPSTAEYQAYGIDTSGWQSAAPAAADAPTGREFGTKTCPALPTAEADGPLAEAASVYWQSRDAGGAMDGTDTAVVPYLALFRALHRADPGAADRLARATTSWPAPGTRFLAFHLQTELGRGAFGRVYLARQGDLADRPVALKVACDFQGEPQRLAQLQHTNIVPVYSVHRAEPFHALCMPYFGATTLADVMADLRRRSTVPESGRALVEILGRRSSAVAGDRATAAGELAGRTYVEAVLWLALKLADGLAHAHERGILHRDLKPANVLLANDGQPMVLDFNLSADVKEPAGAAAAHMGGTLPYMPPELLAALAASATKSAGRAPAQDALGDVYALGVILWELLGGRHPFPVYPGSTPNLASRMGADRQTPANVRSANPAVSHAVAAIVAKCLAPAPAHRYQSAGQLREDVQRQFDHRPLRFARDPSQRERLHKAWRRHSRAAVALIAAAVLLPLAVLYVVRGRELALTDSLVQLKAFRDDKQTALMLLGLHDLPAGERTAGADAADAALARYQVLTTPGPTSARTLALLPPADQDGVRRDISELLLVRAEQAVRDARRSPTSPDQLRDAERWNELAERYMTDGPGYRALLVQRASLARKAGDLDRAARLREQARAVPARSALDWYPEIDAELRQGKFRAAVRLLDEALRPDPRNAFLWYLRGQCLYQIDDYDRAVGSLDASIALVPGFYRGYYERGLARLQRHDAVGACADFDEALRLKPDFRPAFMQRAVARADRPDFDGAINDLDRARDLPGAPTQVYFMAARIRSAAGDRDGAARDHAEGLRRPPTDDVDFVVRGLARMTAEPQAALDDFDQALRLNDRNLSALRNKAHVLSEWLGLPAEAVVVLDTLLERYPDAIADRASRGVLLARLGRREAAHADARAALAGDDRSFNAYQVAGIYALTSKQQPDDAREALRLLSTALQKGVGLEYVGDDHDLDPIRDRPEFGQAIAAARTLKAGAASSGDRR
jgi:serine/threonine protein kinase/tetratricopeptide (TPR) repeat protein